jgi:hypothetical protein
MGSRAIARVANQIATSKTMPIDANYLALGHCHLQDHCRKPHYRRRQNDGLRDRGCKTGYLPQVLVLADYCSCWSPKSGLILELFGLARQYWLRAEFKKGRRKGRGCARPIMERTRKIFGRL